MRETEIAAEIADWLRSTGWVVGEEVQLQDGPRCDIVARRGPKVWAIETKRSLSLNLLIQAEKMIPRVQMVSVGVETKPLLSRSGDVLMRLGLGLLSVGKNGVQSHLDPLVRRPDPHAQLRDEIRPEHESGEYAIAGSQTGGHFTPFGATSREVKAFLSMNPGSQMPEIVDGIQHHYGSDEAAVKLLRAMVRKGAIRGIIQRGIGSNARYWPEGTEP